MSDNENMKDAEKNNTDKQNTQENSSDSVNDKNKKLDLKGFFKSLVRFSVYILLIVILGTGFRIILSHYDPNGNNPNRFPGMDIESTPYSQGTNKIGGNKDSSGLTRFFEKFFPMNKWSFPYKNKFSETNTPGIFGNIILWLTESLAFSNQFLRKLTGTIIESVSEYKDNNYAFWIFGSIILFVFPFVPILGLVSGFTGPIMAFERIWVGWRIFLLMCLPFLIPALLYALAIISSASVFAHIQSIYTVLMAVVFFLVFPYSLPNSFDLFKETLSSHRYGILRALLFAVVLNSFRYLNNGFGIGALALFVLTLIGLV